MKVQNRCTDGRAEYLPDAAARNSGFSWGRFGFMPAAKGKLMPGAPVGDASNP